MASVSIIALVISLYGAVLATVVFRAQRRRDQRTVAVSCHFGYVPRQPDDETDREHVRVITIEAQNIGLRPVEIRSAGFLRDNGDRVQPTVYLIEPEPLPHTLTDGASMRFHYRAEGALPPNRVLEVDEVFVDGGAAGVWKGAPDEWLRPVTIEKRWPHV